MEKIFSAQFYKSLRDQVVSLLGPDQILVIPAATYVLRNGDSHFPFRQNSDYAYLTGLDEADGCLVLGHDIDIIFVLPADPFKEQWDGFRLGAAKAQQLTGCSKAYTIDKFLQVAVPMLREYKHIMTTNLEINCAQINQLAGYSPDYEDATDLIGSLRIIKQPPEINVMHHSAKIAAGAHIKAMQAVKPGMFEYELEAIFLAEFKKNGAESPAYTSIVGSGNNACILHYTENSQACAAGDLVLIDAGCEYGGYASDITRTFPVSGKFSESQRIIYQIVLDAQLKVIQAIKPGITTVQLHDMSVEEITKGLVVHNLLTGDIEQLIQQKAYSPFYMHRVGHWLGRDVHDIGRRGEKEGTALEAGMVLTVEPGIYIKRGLEGVDHKWWGIGVRIEDDVLVTETGSMVLSAAAPKQIDQIEALCSR